MSRTTLKRLILLLAVSLLLMYLGRYTSLSRYFDLDLMTDTMQEAGTLGICLFTLAYVAGTLMNLPGVIFLFISFNVYAGMMGVFIAYMATLLSMVAHFYFARGLAGEALSEIKQPFIRKHMEKMNTRPVLTTAILRLVLFVSPPVNYALALSSIRFRDFLLGSMLALPFNLATNYILMVYAKDEVLHWLGLG